jgi:hypothetical protein
MVDDIDDKLKAILQLLPEAKRRAQSRRWSMLT